MKLDQEEMKGTVRRLLAPTGEGIMETLLDQMEELFMEKGIERGRREGMDLGRREGMDLGRREGVDLGRREGVDLGRRETLLRLLRKRFGDVGLGIEARVNGANAPALDAWTDRVLTARTLDEVFAEG